MLQRNRFCHQEYTSAAPTAPYRLLAAPPQPAVGSEEFARRMGEVGRAYRAAGVCGIVLVHGTFVGNDFFELAPLLEPWLPQFAESFRRANKRFFDRVLADAGNFTEEYAAVLERSLGGDGPVIPVQRFIWSGFNCHLARAMGAVRLIDELATWELPAIKDSAADAGRILCFGHSHGGNVLSLATHLLATDADERREFLDLLRSAVPKQRGSSPRDEAWQRACRRLETDAGPDELLAGRRLDIVTLGSPIRYGWDPGGYDHLLHFVNHRPRRRLAEHRAGLPHSLDELLSGRAGDYVHQLGVAGSNFSPLPWLWGRWRAERRLRKLISPGMAWYHWPRRLRRGMRVADAGTTLLIDYGLPRRRRRLRHILGHGMYTYTEQMLFHAEQVAREFYGFDSCAASAGAKKL